MASFGTGSGSEDPVRIVSMIHDLFQMSGLISLKAF
jgi:hypothetical protein